MNTNNHSSFEKLTELAGSFKIFLSPFLAGLIVAAIVYLINPVKLNLYIATAIIFLSILIGFLWARKIYRSKNGSIYFISRVDASPELDDLNNKENKNDYR